MADGNLTQEEISSLLSKHGGDLNARDDMGLSVILVAARHDTRSPNFPVLNYLLNREDIPRIDKIDALEMAGAILLCHDGNHEMFPLAFQYWRRALALRLMDTGDSRPIFKTPTKSKSGQLSEWSTMEDLQIIEQDPTQRVIQSFLVRLRICSSLCKSALYECFFLSFSNFMSMQVPHVLNHHISQVLDLSWITLDTILSSERPHERHLLDSVIEIESELICLFLFFPKGDPKLTSENLQKFVELLLMTDLPYLTNPNTNMETPIVESYHLRNLSYLVEILATRPEIVTQEIRLSLLQLVRSDVRCSPDDGYNLLHFACISIEPCLSSIRFLVKLGANPNARSTNYGLGVLHMLAFRPESETRDAAARLLLKHGAHLDTADVLGRTAGDHWLRVDFFSTGFLSLFAKAEWEVYN